MLCLKAVIQLFLFILIKLAQCDILVYRMDTHEIELEFKDVPSKFGDPIPSEGVVGLVTYANPAEACSNIDTPPIIQNYTGKWIVLIKRYGCNFEQKVRNAQKAGYDAAIIHNVDSSVLKPMAADNPLGIHIPSVFIGSDSGALIKDNYLYYSGYFILITDYVPFNITLQILIVFAVFLIFLIFAIILCLFVKLVRNRPRSRRLLWLPYSCLKKLSTHKFKKGDHYEICAICLEEYVEDDNLRILPCSHAYHSKCIDPWLTKNKRVCPVCKRKVYPNGEVDTNAESDTEDLTAPLVGSSRTATNGGTFSTNSMGRNCLGRPSSPSSSSGSVRSGFGGAVSSQSQYLVNEELNQEYSVNYEGTGGADSHSLGGEFY